MMNRDKRGQVTLFIILSILLVASIVILFYYLSPGIFFQRTDQPRLEDCISNSLDSHIKSLALTAGIRNPSFNYMYMGDNYTFLCYTDEYYRPCVNQEPLLTKVFEDSLAYLLSQEFQQCYDASVDDLVRRGYDVTAGKAVFNISIEPQGVVIDIDAPMKVSSEYGAVTTQRYKYTHKTNLYELLMVATSLVQFETYYGDSEQTTQMFYYPKIIIDKQRRDGDVKVYTLREKSEKIEYRFAIKSYPWPAGGYIE